MRPSLALLFLLIAVPVSSQERLGSQQLGPAPGGRSGLIGTSSRTGHLIVWRDTRGVGEYNRIFMASRLEPDGKVLDPAGIVLGRDEFSTGPVVGSDGEDYLILLAGRAIRMRADGSMTSIAFPYRFFFVALEWNGSSYLMAFHSPDGSVAVLLDRDGRVLTGELRIPSRIDGVAGHDGRWLVGSRWTYTDKAELYGVGTGDFPAAGTFATAPEPRIRHTGYGHVAVARDAVGLLSVRSVDRSVVVQRHGADGQPAGEPVIYPRNIGIAPFSVRARGAALYLACDTVLIKLGRRMAETTRPAVPGKIASITPLVHPGGGVVAAWIDTRRSEAVLDTVQVYAARVDSEEWRTGGRLVTLGLKEQTEPRVASGAGVHLVAWLENGAEGTRVMAAVVDEDGRQLYEALALSGVFSGIEQLVVASDGIDFVVAWREPVGPGGEYLYSDARSLAVIVSHRGELVRGAFALPRTSVVTSVVWDGTSYVFGAHRGDFRVTSGGVVLDTEVRSAATQLGVVDILLAADGGRVRRVARLHQWDPCSASHCVWYEYSFLPGVRPPFNVYRWEPYDAVVAGGGRTFVIAFTTGERYVVANDIGQAVASDYGVRPRRIHAAWAGDRLFVAAGKVLAEHRIDGTLIALRELTTHARETAIAADAFGNALVIREQDDDRNVPRLLISRIASSRSAPATR